MSEQILLHLKHDTTKCLCPVHSTMRDRTKFWLASAHLAVSTRGDLLRSRYIDSRHVRRCHQRLDIPEKGQRECLSRQFISSRGRTTSGVEDLEPPDPPRWVLPRRPSEALHIRCLSQRSTPCDRRSSRMASAARKSRFSRAASRPATSASERVCLCGLTTMSHRKNAKHSQSNAHACAYAKVYM